MAFDAEAATLLELPELPEAFSEPPPAAAARRRLVKAAVVTAGALAIAGTAAHWGSTARQPQTANRDALVEEWTGGSAAWLAAPLPAPAPAPAVWNPWGPAASTNVWDTWGTGATKAQPATTAAPATAAPATVAPGVVASAGVEAPKAAKASATANLGDIEALPVKKLSAQEQAQRVAALKKANGIYSQPMAQAFAALAKLSYCGALPGVPSAVTETCAETKLVGVESTCEAAKISIPPAMVRTITRSDGSTADAYFAYVAQVVPQEGSSFKPGVLISIRGSIDNYGNSVRDKQKNQVNVTATNCPDCKMHQGYHEEYHAIAAQLQANLDELCLTIGSPCTIYATGHGSGAAMATLTLFELAQKNYTIGPSYMFESPKIANEAMANHLNKLFAYEQGPVFQVTHGKDSLPRWPFGTTYMPWGIEAYYPGTAAKADALCWADDQQCGISNIPVADLTQTHSCKHPLAPNEDFCVFKSFVPQCYGGLGFNIIAANPNLPLSDIDQPIDKAAASWSPAEDAENRQNKELAKKHNVSDYYSIQVMKAAAALAKLAYCGNLAGVPNAVQSTCNGRSGVCSQAGFGIVPSTVQPRDVNNGNLFFYTALARRSTAEYAKAPYFIASEFCILAFRGTINEANSNMNRQTAQVPLGDSDCGNCTANTGLLAGWTTIEPVALQALQQSGCQPGQGNNKQVMIVGHSMGGTMATLAVYMLHKKGFDVQLSWSLEGGRPGGPELMSYINDKMITTRPVPLWQTTNGKDGIPRTPKSTYSGGPVGRNRYMVAITNNQPGKAVLCTGEPSDDDSCGTYQWGRSDLVFKVPSNEHCNLKFAPGGVMCMIPGYYWPSPYAVASQCSYGGSL